MDEYKPAGKERIVELKSPQKRASEPAKTATGSKLESALCSLQFPMGNSSRTLLLRTHFHKHSIRKCAPNNGVLKIKIAKS